MTTIAGNGAGVGTERRSRLVPVAGIAHDGPFWASASRAMPAAVAGTAMGLINALGNLGGFVGPYLGGYLQDVGHSRLLSTSVVLAAALLLGGPVMLTLRGRANPARRA
jgi:MFS family permease